MLRSMKNCFQMERRTGDEGREGRKRKGTSRKSIWRKKHTNKNKSMFKNRPVYILFLLHFLWWMTHKREKHWEIKIVFKFHKLFV